MAEEKNPFGVLGFAPAVFRGLSGENIRSLVRTQYRELTRIFHHDRGGDPKRFKEVQEANVKLVEDFEFDFWLKNFLRTKKDHLEDAHKEKKVAQEVGKLYSRRLVDFWLAYCQGRHLLDWNSTEVFHGMCSDQMSGWAGFSIFNPPPLSCLILEVSLAAKRRGLEVQIGSLSYAMPDSRSHLRNADGSLRNFDESFELRILPDGSMTRQNLVRVQFNAHDFWRPSVRKDWIFLNSGRPKNSYYERPNGQPFPVKGKLLGSLTRETIKNLKSIEDSSPVAVAITADINMDEFAATKTGYSFHEFEPYFRFLQPMIRDGSYLVLLEGESEENFRFKILGTPRKIIPLEE